MLYTMVAIMSSPLLTMPSDNRTQITHIEFNSEAACEAERKKLDTVFRVGASVCIKAD